MAHGFTIDLFEPTSLRRNDLKLLGESDLNERLYQVQEGGIQYKAYGDSIYPHLSNITSSWRNANLSDRQRRENAKMKSVRISIEWNYGHAANLFGYLRNLHKLRVMNGGTVIKIYTVDNR